MCQTGVIEALAEGTQRSTGEQNDSLELLVEEEIVETPDRAILSKGVQGEIWIVRVDVALQQVDLGVESVPQLVMDLAILTGCGDTQEIVNVVGHKLSIKVNCSLTVKCMKLSPEDLVLW